MPKKKPGEEAQVERERKPQYWDRLKERLARAKRAWLVNRKWRRIA